MGLTFTGRRGTTFKLMVLVIWFRSKVHYGLTHRRTTWVSKGVEDGRRLPALQGVRSAGCLKAVSRVAGPQGSKGLGMTVPFDTVGQVCAIFCLPQTTFLFSNQWGSTSLNMELYSMHIRYCTYCNALYLPFCTYCTYCTFCIVL
jgi:hypothetical protein